MEKQYIDKELGPVTIRLNEKAVRYILRVKDGAVVATMPRRGNEKTLLEFLEKNRDFLRRQLAERSPRQLDESTVLHTSTFSLHIFRASRANFYLSLKEGVLHIACPQETDFSSERVQATLNGLLEKALRHEAKRVLPGRLQELAAQYGFAFSGIKIQGSRTRWGSCSGRRTINLSLYLMLLPPHLIDYVLLHELCHTVEMNHGEKFWALMDRVTAGRAKALRRELKAFRTAF